MTNQSSLGAQATSPCQTPACWEPGLHECAQPFLFVLTQALGLVSQRLYCPSHRMELRAIISSHLFKTTARTRSLSTCSTKAAPRPSTARRSPFFRIWCR